jgi:hypothetical protein
METASVMHVHVQQMQIVMIISGVPALNVVSMGAVFPEAPPVMTPSPAQLISAMRIVMCVVCEHVQRQALQTRAVMMISVKVWTSVKSALFWMWVMHAPARVKSLKSLYALTTGSVI